MKTVRRSRSATSPLRSFSSLAVMNASAAMVKECRDPQCPLAGFRRPALGLDHGGVDAPRDSATATPPAMRSALPQAASRPRHRRRWCAGPVPHPGAEPGVEDEGVSARPCRAVAGSASLSVGDPERRSRARRASNTSTRWPRRAGRSERRKRSVSSRLLAAI